MKVRGWGQTDVGLKRAINQDTIYMDDSLGLYVVADGMGGHKGGEVASAMAVSSAKEIIRSEVLKENFSPRDVISKVYKEASERIYHISTVEKPDLQGMGTTMVLGLFYKGSFYIGNVGDSRCYMFLNNHLWQLTEDHSLVNEQVRAGIITEDEVHMMVGKNVITRSVGYEKEVQVDVVKRKVVAGEKFLLCSDGLCGLVPDVMVEDLLQKYSGGRTVKECVERAKEAGGDDNISVIIVEVSP